MNNTTLTHQTGEAKLTEYSLLLDAFGKESMPTSNYLSRTEEDSDFRRRARVLDDLLEGPNGLISKETPLDMYLIVLRICGVNSPEAQEFKNQRADDAAFLQGAQRLEESYKNTDPG